MAEEVSVGQILQNARERRGLSPADVANATKIPLAHVEALERNDWAALPASVYALGFLKIYAKYLGLDPNPLVLRANVAGAPPGRMPEESPGPAEAPSRRAVTRLVADRPRARSPRTPRPVRETPARPSSITAVIVLIVALAGVGYLLTHHPKPSESAPPPATHHIGTKGRRARGRSSRGSRGTHRRHRHATAPSSTTPVLTNDSATNIAFTTTASPVNLSLNFSAPCWIEEWINGVNQGSGGVTYQAGQSVTLSATESLEVELANPAVVTFSIDGHNEGAGNAGANGDPVRYLTVDVTPPTG